MKNQKTFFELFLYSEQPETSTHTYLSFKKKNNNNNKPTQEQTKHNVQVIQLHQVCSRRRKEKGDPPVKPSFETS